MRQYKPTEKPKQYYLPKKWVEYLTNQPETGMGYQIADIYLKGKTLESVIILGCSTFNHKNKKLNLSKIEKIVVKEREGYETKKFETVSVKNTPTKKTGKYYLIEEYTEYSDNPCSAGTSWKSYEVQSFNTQEQPLETLLKGSKHGGKLIPAKGLELKLQLTEEEQLPYNKKLRDELAEDAKRREEAYRKTGDIIDEKEIEKYRADHGVIS